MAKIYVGAAKGLIGQDSATEIAKILTGLVENQDEIGYSSDENGHFFSVSAETLDKFLAAVGSDDETEDADDAEAPTPRRRGPGRPRKTPESPPEE